MRTATLEIIGHKFQVQTLPLRIAAELMDYQQARLGIPYEMKLMTIIEGARLMEKGKEGAEYPTKLDEEKLNQLFTDHPNGFLMLYNAVVRVTSDGDQKKSEEYSKTAMEFNALFQNPTK